MRLALALLAVIPVALCDACAESAPPQFPHVEHLTLAGCNEPCVTTMESLKC